ncbi:MAG: DNA-directed RNA polymerase subunit B [Candidatus Aenigmarchaeota archaeon]|nr:DNA-directed RNA polymerase subunit B [Candidatus Aenigmarchaeota archaeon]
MADIYFNGKWIGHTSKPAEMAANIRKKRRQNSLLSQVNISYFPLHDEIRINTEHGRARRPLIIVENKKPKLTPVLLDKLKREKITWNYLIENGIIEYLDADEEENTFIAINENELTNKHTHLEIDPIGILGVPTTLIPYPEFSRGDRINFGAKMIGQSVGIPATNFTLRTDTKFNILVYPQVPLVNTITSDILRRFPSGHNLVIAVMCHEGYNVNDAIVLNKSSIERGLFRSFYFRTYDAMKKRYWGGQEDDICVPQPGIMGHRGEDAYKDLDEDGILNPESKVESDSILIGRTSPLRFLTSEEFIADIENIRETSLSVRHGERGIVDTVLITETPDANQLIKMKIRDQRIPEIGDKFASRHGQKGIVGLMIPHEDMPFTREGVVPDIIFNPHAIPSRMTVGHLLEIIGGKLGAYSGEHINASAFNYTSEEEIRKSMKSLGFRNDGKQVLYNGKSGEILKVLIFTGISYYLRLDHMVTDKIHVRGRGPVTLLTKQPTEGRAKRGGLRLGEMEQQCLIGHGAALTLKERFDSDKVDIPICKGCGFVATFDVIKNKSYCSLCKKSDVAWVETSYAFKLTLDELKSLGIYPKIKTEEL